MPNDARLSVVLGAAQVDTDGHQWIEVIPTAEKARNGRWYFTITSDDLRTYAASIEAQPGLIPIDYDHTEGTGTVAAGWFTGETEIVDAGAVNRAGETQDHESLWARVAWTPQAVEEIQTGRYKRLSPEFDFHERDKKTGLLTKARQIVASTLTNRPFFKELAPVGAQSDVLWDRNTGYQAVRDRIAAELNPGDSWRYCILDMDIASHRALVEDTREACTYVMPFELDADGTVTIAPSSDWTAAQQEWVSAAREAETTYRGREAANQEGDEMPDLKVIATTLGLPEDASEEEIVEAAKAARDTATAAGASDENVVKLTKTQHSELEAKAMLGVKASQDLAEMRVTSMLDTAERERRAVPAERESLVALCKDGDSFDDDRIAGVKAALDARPKGLIGVEHGSGGDGENDSSPAEVKAATKEFQIDDGVKVIAAGDGEVDLHVKAVKLLTDRGKHEYTAAEYAAAYQEAEKAA